MYVYMLEGLLPATVVHLIESIWLHFMRTGVAPAGGLSPPYYACVHDDSRWHKQGVMITRLWHAPSSKT